MGAKCLLDVRCRRQSRVRHDQGSTDGMASGRRHRNAHVLLSDESTTISPSPARLPRNSLPSGGQPMGVGILLAVELHADRRNNQNSRQKHTASYGTGKAPASIRALELSSCPDMSVKS